MPQRLPTYLLSHGGGPWPWVKAQRPGVYDELEASLKRIRAELGEVPRASKRGAHKSTNPQKP